MKSERYKKRGPLKKLFNYVMVHLTVSLARALGYTPKEVLKMYDRVGRGLPTFDDDRL